MLCAFLVGPWVDRGALVYQIAGVLMLIGVVLWGVTMFVHKPEGGRFRDVEHLGE